MKIRLGSFRRGVAGTAQELIVNVDAGDPLAWVSGIGNWFIEAPNQSPAWQHYLLSGVHLRPIEGVKPAVIAFPGATHEFMMYALAPDRKPEPLDDSTWSFLTPHNLSEQFTARDDATAAKLLELCATSICFGRLWAEPPLSGQVEPWRTYLRQWSRELSESAQ